MKTFRLTSKAKNDLKQLAKDTQNKWGKNQRNTYLKNLDDAFHLIASKPEIGKKCDFIKSGYHKYPQGSHVIFYRKCSTTNIRIIRILHKRMDFESKFDD